MIFLPTHHNMASSSQYLVDNSMVLSSRIKYKGTIAGNTTVNLPEEVVSQFGNVQLSIFMVTPVNPMTMTVFASNDTNGSPTWTQVASYQPSAETNIYSLNLAYRRIYVSLLTTTAASNNINLIALYSTAPLPAVDITPAVKTIDDAVTNSDLLALGRNILMGRGKILFSDVSNTTISADSSLRVIDGAKMHAFDNADKLILAGKLPLENSRLVRRAAAPATTTVNDGASVIATGGASTLATVTTLVSPVVDDNSIVVVRGSGIFTASSTGVGYTRTTYGHVGVGTSAANFGFWYNIGGRIPVATLTITSANTTNTTVDITLNGVVYSCSITLPHPDYRVGCASRIVDAFNVLGSPWLARQIGENVVFTGLAFGVTGSLAVSSPDVTFNGTMAATVAGSAGTWSFVPASTFNINTLSSWASGDYVDYEISLINNGKTAKLAVLDKATQESVDALTFTFSSPLGVMVPDNLITVAAFDTAANNVTYGLTVNVIKGTAPSRPISSVAINVPNIYAYNQVAPVATIQKIGTTFYNAILRKMIITTDQPTRVNVALSTGSRINGQIPYDGLTTDGYVSTSFTTYGDNLDPLLFGFIPGNIIAIKDAPPEILLDQPINIAEPITVALGTGDFVPSNASLWLYIDYY